MLTAKSKPSNDFINHENHTTSHPFSHQSTMADDGAAEDFTTLPIPALFAHKNWKARKLGYESAAKHFRSAQPSDPLVRECLLDLNLWKNAVGDSNVAAQQEALNAYNAFLDCTGAEGARKTRGQTVQGVVEKGLTGRPAAKAAALETLMLLVELDKPEPVIEELLPFLAHKQPKIIAAVISAFTSIYHAYGCKTVEPKPVIKLLPKAYAHADKNVRAEAQNLTVELYRWLREAMKPLFWGELKDVQQRDLEKLFEPVKEEPMPKQERLLRSQQAAKEEAAAAGPTDDGEVADEEEAAPEIDLEPEYEAVDAFAKIPKDFGDRLASAKWKDRKEALEETFTAVNHPAIQEGPFDEVIRGCAKSMKDANIAVVTVAANCVEAMAKGLRRSFGRYKSQVLSAMLERFKEKKVTVTDALAAACDAVFASTSLSDIQTDVVEAMKNKNPQIKEHSTKFLVRSLKITREVPSMEQTKELAEVSKKLLTESAPALRDAGAEVLGVLWKIMGDRNMLSQLDGLDELRKTKVKEFCDAAEVRAKWKPAPVAAPKVNGAPAGGRKPAAGGQRRPAPAGVKRPAATPRAASPQLPAQETPLQPRATSRPVAKGPAGLKPPGAGLKAPGSGLQKPGSGLKAPSSGTASPKRQGVLQDEQPKPNPTTAGRGLAGRPLGKPPASPPPASAAAVPSTPRHESSALSTIERQELSDLRSELDLLRNTSSDLRQDKSRLLSQINELQNQNAQLIEDHTRDVLQIKAKETQLVRSRGDAEEAEERANGLSKEIDRLKREMGRLQRGPPGGGEGRGEERPGYGSSRSFNVPAARGYGDVGVGAGGTGVEGKENSNPEVVVGDGKLSGQFSAPTTTTKHLSNGADTPLESEPSPPGSGGRGEQGLMRSQSEGVESWRRAAEVTQNLKARIEMMKVCLSYHVFA